MESPTYSFGSKVALQGRFPLTAATMAVLGSIAALPPSVGYSMDFKPNYSIAANAMSSGGFMGFAQKSNLTQSTIGPNIVPIDFGDIFSSDTFFTPLMQGLQFIQKMAFLPVDTEIDKAIDAHFSAKNVRTKKLFVNPHKKRS